MRSSALSLLSGIGIRNRLRLTAIDKRLEVHQKAFAQCVKLWLEVNAGDEKKIIATRTKYFEWWLDNCLYLSNKAKEEFLKACVSADITQVELINVSIALEKEVSLPNLTEKNLFSVADWRESKP